MEARTLAVSSINAFFSPLPGFIAPVPAPRENYTTTHHSGEAFPAEIEKNLAPLFPFEASSILGKGSVARLARGSTYYLLAFAYFYVLYVHTCMYCMYFEVENQWRVAQTTILRVPHPSFFCLGGFFRSCSMSRASVTCALAETCAAQYQWSARERLLCLRRAAPSVRARKAI